MVWRVVFDLFPLIFNGRPEFEANADSAIGLKKINRSSE